MSEKRIAGTIGMFDITKGIGMILIVFGHSFSFSLKIEPEMNSVIAAAFLAVLQLTNALLPAHFYNVRLQL